MKKSLWLIPVVGVVGAVLFATVSTTGKVPAEIATLQSARGTTEKFCMGRGKCLVAFVAPWCGYCRKSTPLIQTLLKKYQGEDFKVNVVVSADENASMDPYAAELGKGAFYDPQTAFATSVGVRGFPTWVLFDDKGTAVKTASGAFPSQEQLFTHMGIKL